MPVSPEKRCFCGRNAKFKDCHMKGLVLPDPRPNGMHFDWIGGIEIYRPRQEAEEENKIKAEQFLRQKFEPGVYREKGKVQAILHGQVDFYGTKVDEIIPKLASRSFLEFVLWQYDRCGLVEDRRRGGELTGDALKRWTHVNHCYPRALKYIAERITMCGPDESAEFRKPSVDEIDELFICAEQLVGYCITSDLTQLFPNDSQIIVQEKNLKTYLDHSLTNESMSGFEERVHKDTKIRHTFFEGRAYELDFKAHAKILDEPLCKSIGLTYTEALGILARLKEGCTAIPGDPFQSKFVLIDGVIKRVAEIFQKPPSSIERLLSGFWLTKEGLLKRSNPNEDLWKPSLSDRAYRRALFVMPHLLGDHVAFSDRMFTESLTIMLGTVSYGSFPKEWLTEEVKTAIGKIVSNQGHWFEEELKRNLKSVGILGFAGKRSLGCGTQAINLPGEFDFIGWSRADDALILIEAKMMQPASEPGLWKNQCDNFVQKKNGSENFVEKLTRKSIWLTHNRDAVVNALRSEGLSIEGNPSRVLAGFITYAPTAASYFVSTFPCVCLSEFMNDYRSKMRWPYITRIYD